MHGQKNIKKKVIILNTPKMKLFRLLRIRMSVTFKTSYALPSDLPMLVDLFWHSENRQS